MSNIDELKQQYIKTFDNNQSYIHRDDIDLLIQKIDEALKSIIDHETRITELEKP